MKISKGISIKIQLKDTITIKYSFIFLQVIKRPPEALTKESHSLFTKGTEALNDNSTEYNNDALY